MPVNTSLADASNAFTLIAVLLYALAMLSYACDFAFRKERLLAPAAVPVLVTAGAPAPVASTVPSPPRSTAGRGATCTSSSSRSRSWRWSC
jgi:hypothetical protein